MKAIISYFTKIYKEIDNPKSKENWSYRFYMISWVIMVSSIQSFLMKSDSINTFFRSLGMHYLYFSQDLQY